MLRFVVFIPMQYKFCVDGVWRHDESQPFITGDYGLVNTILIREPDMIPSTYSHQPPDVDMDYDVVMPPVRQHIYIKKFKFCFSNAASVPITVLFFLVATVIIVTVQVS